MMMEISGTKKYKAHIKNVKSEKQIAVLAKTEGEARRLLVQVFGRELDVVLEQIPFSDKAE